MLSDSSDEDGVIFEIGEGPRGENDHVTSLLLDADFIHFTLLNQPSNTSLMIPTALQNNNWHHLAFVYNSEENQLKHYVDGKIQKLPPTAQIKSLTVGEEDYMSIGRDGSWKRPLPGRIDELRFSEGMVYNADFKLPGSFSYLYDQSLPEITLKKADPLLFTTEKASDYPIQIGTRKHLFIDDAIIEEMGDLNFVVNPPLRMERVIGNIKGAFRKHLNEIEKSYLELILTYNIQNWTIYEKDGMVYFYYEYVGDDLRKDVTDLANTAGYQAFQNKIEPLFKSSDGDKKQVWRYMQEVFHTN